MIHRQWEKLAGKETKETFLGNENVLQLDEGVATEADRPINSLTYTINVYAVHCMKNKPQ